MAHTISKNILATEDIETSTTAYLTTSISYSLSLLVIIKNVCFSTGRISIIVNSGILSTRHFTLTPSFEVKIQKNLSK